MPESSLRHLQWNEMFRDSTTLKLDYSYLIYYSCSIDVTIWRPSWPYNWAPSWKKEKNQLTKPQRENKYCKWVPVRHLRGTRGSSFGCSCIWVSNWITEILAEGESHEAYLAHMLLSCWHRCIMEKVLLEPFGMGRSDVVMNSFIFILICYRPKHSFYINLEYSLH